MYILHVLPFFYKFLKLHRYFIYVFLKNFFLFRWSLRKIFLICLMGSILGVKNLETFHVQIFWCCFDINLKLKSEILYRAHLLVMFKIVCLKSYVWMYSIFFNLLQPELMVRLIWLKSWLTQSVMFSIKRCQSYEDVTLICVKYRNASFREWVLFRSNLKFQYVGL